MKREKNGRNWKKWEETGRTGSHFKPSSSSYLLPNLFDNKIMQPLLRGRNAYNQGNKSDELETESPVLGDS